jgi:parvulin-like peptidyl-prolyl isomerase
MTFKSPWPSGNSGKVGRSWLLASGLVLLSLSRAPAAQEEPKPPQKDREKPAGTAKPGEGSPAGKGAEKSNLPPGIIARLNGRDITLDEYGSYLLASIGKSRLDEYLDRLLVEEEAKSLGISVEPAEVESRLEEQVDRTIKSLYQGKKEGFVESLAKRRSNLEEYKAKQRQDLYFEMLAERVILKTRQPTEADLKKQFEKTYGEGGVQYTLRHILISTRAPIGGPGASPGPGPEGARTNAEAKEKAEKILKELQGGADFAQAVKQYSDDAFTKRNDGRIPQYRKGFYGESFHQAVTQLTPEKPLSGIVESPRGFHIIQLLEKQVTKFEDVKPELEKVVMNQAPTPKERHDLAQRLREKAKIDTIGDK